MTTRLGLLTAIIAACALPLWAADDPAPTDAPANTDLVEAFRADCLAKAEKSGQAAPTMVVPGKDGWLFLRNELRHLGVGTFWGPEAKRVSRAHSAEHADPLPAILDFKKQLDKAGVELLLVPVPPKAAVYPEMVSDRVSVGKGGKPPRLDAAHQEFYALLRREGVKVLDLTDELTARRFDRDDGPAYCKQDTHWSGQACVLAARRIAAEVKDRPWLKDVERQEYQSKPKRVQIEGDLWDALAGDKPAKESIPLRFVGKGKDLAPVEPSRDSPVILLGDSHNLIFHAGGEDMHAKGAGLADQLALELGFPVDLVAVRGSGATPARVNMARLARGKPDYLGKKKLVVWCFAAREFTESQGWQSIPVVK